MINIELNSNDGWSVIGFEICEIIEIQHVKYVILNIKISSQFWDLAALRKTEKYELRKFGDAQIFRVIVVRTQLERFINRMDTWLENSMAFQFVLSDIQDQFIQIALGPSSEKISSMSKPVLKFDFSSSRIDVKIRFVTDQCCISSFAHGLKCMTLPR